MQANVPYLNQTTEPSRQILRTFRAFGTAPRLAGLDDSARPAPPDAQLRYRDEPPLLLTAGVRRSARVATCRFAHRPRRAAGILSPAHGRDPHPCELRLPERVYSAAQIAQEGRCEHVEIRCLRRCTEVGGAVDSHGVFHAAPSRFSGAHEPHAPVREMRHCSEADVVRKDRQIAASFTHSRPEGRDLVSVPPECLTTRRYSPSALSQPHRLDIARAAERSRHARSSANCVAAGSSELCDS